jgi:hypothetical protein
MTGEGQTKNDVELWHLGLSKTVNTQTGEDYHEKYHKEKSVPIPDGHEAGISRRAWSLYFANAQDSLLSIIYPLAIRSMGSVIIPDFKCFQEPRRRIPTLVLVGKHSMYASVPDCQQIAKHYQGRCRVYAASACMPFAEEGPAFYRDVSRFLGNKKKSKSSSKPKKKKKKRSKKKKKRSSPEKETTS